MRYAHTNIVSNDWRRLADFYIKVFDCKVIPPIRSQEGHWLCKGTGVSNAKLEGAHLLLPGHGPDGPPLEIYQYSDIEQQEPISPNRRGFGHLAFEVESVEKKLEEIESNGGSNQGEIVSRIVEGAGEITFVYARDPEGNLIELQKWKLV